MLLLSSGHSAVFSAHPGVCTHRHPPASAGKGVRESLLISLLVKSEIGLILVFMESIGSCELVPPERAVD